MRTLALIVAVALLSSTALAQQPLAPGGGPGGIRQGNQGQGIGWGPPVRPGGPPGPSPGPVGPPPVGPPPSGGLPPVGPPPGIAPPPSGGLPPVGPPPIAGLPPSGGLPPVGSIRFTARCRPHSITWPGPCVWSGPVNRTDTFADARARDQLDRRSGSRHSHGAWLDRSSATDGRHWRRQLASDWRQRHRCRPHSITWPGSCAWSGPVIRTDTFADARARDQLDRRSGSRHSHGAWLDRSSATDGRHWRRQLASDWRQRHHVACCQAMARSRHRSGRDDDRVRSAFNAAWWPPPPAKGQIELSLRERQGRAPRQQTGRALQRRLARRDASCGCSGTGSMCRPRTKPASCPTR